MFEAILNPCLKLCVTLSACERLLLLGGRGHRDQIISATRRWNGDHFHVLDRSITQQLANLRDTPAPPKPSKFLLKPPCDCCGRRLGLIFERGVHCQLCRSKVCVACSRRIGHRQTLCTACRLNRYSYLATVDCTDLLGVLFVFFFFFALCQIVLWESYSQRSHKTILRH